MSWVTALMGILTSLPKIVELLSRLGQYFSGKDDLVTYLGKVDAVINEFEKAEAPYDRLQAAKKLRDLIRRV